MLRIDLRQNSSIYFIQVYTVSWVQELRNSLEKFFKNSHRKIRVRKDIIMCLMNQEPYGKLLILFGTGFTKLKIKVHRSWLRGGKAKQVSIVVFVVNLGNIYSWWQPVDGQILQWNTPHFLLSVPMAKQGEFYFLRCLLLPKALQGYFSLNL